MSLLLINIIVDYFISKLFIDISKYCKEGVSSLLTKYVNLKCCKHLRKNTLSWH